MSRQILIVEDEQFLLRTLTRALSSGTSYQVAGVDSLSEAREALETLRPDLVICDLNLGDGTGLEILDLLRRHGLSVPVVVLSGMVDEFADLLPDSPRVIIRRKPLPARELLQLVESQLSLTAPPTGGGVFSLSDYLQMAHFSRRSMRIDLRYPSGTAGTIHVWDGEPYSARVGAKRGDDAIAQMLTRPPAAIATVTLSEPPSQREIELPMHALLLELARLSDEGKLHTDDDDADGESEAPVSELLIASVAALARGDVPAAIECLRDARAGATADERLHAWWCDVMDQRWPGRRELSNGGAA